MINRLTTAVLLLLILPLHSFADTTVSSGLYIGADIGRTTYKGFDGAMSFSANAGYQFNQSWAAEAAYTDLRDDSTRFTLKGFRLVALSDNLNAFAQVGMSFIQTTSDTNEQVLAVGVGAKYNMSNNVGIRFMYEIYDDGVLLPQVGMQFNF